MRSGSGGGLGDEGVGYLFHALSVAVGLRIEVLHVRLLAAMAKEHGLIRHTPRQPKFRTCIHNNLPERRL